MRKIFAHIDYIFAEKSFFLTMKHQCISHVKRLADGRWIIQSNEEHQRNVAIMASGFARCLGLPEWGYTLGLLHDEGKKRESFQCYIRKESGYDHTAKAEETDHSHAFVGGILTRETYGNDSAITSLLANQIASHHRGLYNYDELDCVLHKPLPADFVKCLHSDNSGELARELKEFVVRHKPAKCDYNHLARVLFSCLVDADYLDTERFMNEEAARLRGSRRSLGELLPMLESHIESLATRPGDVNSLRRQVQQRCREVAASGRGAYSLTVPTGGGKTLASVLWALRHAIHNGQRRVIIAIPYTSIIVQTAATLKRIFGEENVLEHHSGFDPDSITNPHLRNRAKLATENWDYPIVVTTNVQLFESIYSNKPSACRKLHNIAGSVIILDEAQTLPTQFLQPIVDSLKAYHKLMGASVLFTTASQPVLSGEIVGCNPSVRFSAFGHVTEIIPAEYRLSERLRRVEINTAPTALTHDDIAAAMCLHRRVLCVVNTRSDAKEVFNRLPVDGSCFHLSRMMCAEHLRSTIDEIKHILGSNDNSPIRVVATQLIEAGVDIDFPVVMRQEAGLDSVLQAAGRCNREGRQDKGKVTVFRIEGRLLRGHIKDANEARKSLPRDSDWLAAGTMAKYFEQLYSRCDSFDKHGIAELLYNPREMCFEDAARHFRLIEDNGVNVIVNFGKAAALIEQLKLNGIDYSLMKQLAAYSVTVHDNDFKELLSTGSASEVVEGVFFIDDASLYSSKVGLQAGNKNFDEIMII